LSNHKENISEEFLEEFLEYIRVTDEVLNNIDKLNPQELFNVLNTIEKLEEFFVLDTLNKIPITYHKVFNIYIKKWNSIINQKTMCNTNANITQKKHDKKNEATDKQKNNYVGLMMLGVGALVGYGIFKLIKGNFSCKEDSPKQLINHVYHHISGNIHEKIDIKQSIDNNIYAKIDNNVNLSGYVGHDLNIKHLK